MCKQNNILKYVDLKNKKKNRTHTNEKIADFKQTKQFQSRGQNRD